MGAEPTSRGGWLSFALIWPQAGGCREVPRHGREGETDPAPSQWQPGCIADSLYASLLQYSPHASAGFCCLGSRNTPVWIFFKHTSCFPEPHNSALAGCLEAVRLKAALPDLTQTHRSDSSTLGLCCAENDRRAQNDRRTPSFLYLWS